MTILELMQSNADEIMDALADSDCSEQMTLHVTRDNAIMRLTINGETYTHNRGEKWNKLKD